MIQPTSAAYARAQKLLLPPGRLWSLIGSTLEGVLLGAGDELVRVSGRVADLIEESDPRTATETLPEWESMLELPSTGTDAERQARIVGKLLERQRFRPTDYQQALALMLGQDADDVVVIERGRVFAVLVGDDNEIYRYFVYRDPTDPGSYSVDDAQAQVDAMEPEHTKGHVIESLLFLCDDPYSLCDRDLLGHEPQSITFDASGTQNVLGDVTYEAWGGGGGTESSGSNPSGGGGGGGYSQTATTYATLEAVTITVGAAGDPEVAGGDSDVADSGGTVVLAKGGSPGTTGGSDGGAGGAAGSGTGDVTNGGGAGGNSGGGAGGGGGGSATAGGAGGAGGNAGGGSGGSGGTGEGAGGDGGDAGLAGEDGFAPGGGGGGDGDTASAATSGAGGRVIVQLDWLPYYWEEL